MDADASPATTIPVSGSSSCFFAVVDVDSITMMTAVVAGEIIPASGSLSFCSAAADAASKQKDSGPSGSLYKTVSLFFVLFHIFP